MARERCLIKVKTETREKLNALSELLDLSIVQVVAMLVDAKLDEVKGE